jgi:hypothetical protein
MPKRHNKSADGKYHIGSNVYDMLIGSRAQVHHGTAYKTSGGLTKSDLVKNKNGRIVSRKVQETAKKQKRLEKAGWTAKKGKFGAVRISAGKSPKKKKSPKRKKSSKSR